MKKSQGRRVALVVPAYNEAAMISQVVAGLKSTFANSGYDFQIVVVDDGSKDETAQLAEDSGAYVISHILNTGSGGATASGLSYAQQAGFDVATTSDADGQHDPKDVLNGVQNCSAVTSICSSAVA